MLLEPIRGGNLPSWEFAVNGLHSVEQEALPGRSECFMSLYLVMEETANCRSAQRFGCIGSHDMFAQRGAEQTCFVPWQYCMAGQNSVQMDWRLACICMKQALRKHGKALARASPPAQLGLWL